MNWNAKPDSLSFPPQYPKKQASFLEQGLSTTSQSSFHTGSNQEPCLFLSNSHPVSQPLLNIRNQKTPPQIPISDLHSGTIVTSQTSVERITYANVKGPKQLSHDLQISSGVTQDVWLNSPMGSSTLSHTGATVSHQTGFGTNIPNVHALQNQFLTSDTYSMQVHVIPSNSGRVPISYQGNPRRNLPLSEQQVDWAPQQASSGLTYQDYHSGPLPKQYSYSSRSFSQEPTLQKQNPMSSVSFQVKNSQSPNPALTFKSKQIAAVPSYQYTVTQTDKRPPPPYDCRYASQSLQSTPRVVKQSSVEVPQSQEMHLPEMRKDFCRDFKQQWQNLNENFSMMGSSCNLKVNTSVNHSFNEPVRSSVTGAQALAQNNQERRVDSQNLTSNQVLDTSVTKEKLVRDIKTLVEIKKKFSDLARKIKINKSLLMAAGCIKTPNTSYSESAQNSGLSLKQTAKIQSGPQLTLVTPETVEDKPPTVMESAEETNRPHRVLSSNLQNRNFNQVSSVLLNSSCSEKLPIPEQVHDSEAVNPLKTSTAEVTQAPLNNTQLTSGNFVSVAQNVSTNSEITFLPHSTSSEEYISKYPNKNRLILSLLTSGGKTQKKLLKDSSECIQDSKLHNFEMNPNTENTGNQLKTMENVNPPRTCNINAKIADTSCFEYKSFNGVSSNSGSPFSMELLATCLSLWKKQPSEPTKEKQDNESKTNTPAIAVSKPAPICESSPFSPMGNSQNKIVNTSQETISSVVAQNYESSGTTTTKGIAVVSPLILSDVNTLSVKDTSEALPETAYPVIKEGSVCSLQNKLTENTAVLKINVNEPVTSTTGITIFPLIEDKQSQSTNTNSEGIPNTNQGKHNESEPDIQCPVSDQQASYISENSSSVGSDVLQIGSICSLVEGDTSYDSQIAEIFNLLPLQKAESQKPLPNYQIMNSRQQNEHFTENKDFVFKEDEFVQCTDASNKITDQSESLQPPALSPLKCVEAKSGILEESSLEHITENENMANDTCSSAAIQQDSYPQEADLSCSYTEQDPTTDESLHDKTSILYLHDQLSELLKEFPYGIEPVNMHESSVVQQMADQISEAQTCGKTDCDSKGSTDQIQITILNTDQMKELFPEQDDQPNEVDKLTEPQKEKPVTKEENQCDPQARGVEEHCASVPLDSEKDDIRCCALGWLSMVYEGVPQCQCNSIKKSTSEEKKQTNPCSPSEAKSYKQGERTSDRDVPVAFNSAPNNPPKIPLTCPVEKKHFPETKQNSNIKDKSKTESNSSLRTEQGLSSQLLSKGDKKLDSWQSHKRKRNLQFHEETFHSASKITKFSQESLQRKFMAQNLGPLKPKMSFLTSKTKDLNMKNGSLVQSVSPEKRKLKSGGSKQSMEERKLDEGIVLDSEIKRKKHDKQEQNKNVGGGAFKFCNFSTPNERTWIKEKTVSNVKSSGSKDSSSKMNRVLSPKEYLSRQKHKEALKKNLLKNSDSQHMRPSKLSVQVESSGKSNERPNGSVQTCKESLSIGTGHGKSIKTHHSKESKTYISRNIKGTVGGKQSDKMWIDRTKLDKNLNNINNEGELSRMSSQTKDQRKLYLNRVAFKCTERERICLTKLDNSPRKFKEKRPEGKSKNLLPVKDTPEKLSMLEFKLCPDGVFKNTNTVEDRKDLQHTTRKEQAPVQVSGIKSTKEDWLKCVTEEKRMPEANQEIDDNVLANSRLSKRNCSADGFEILQNPVKDSKAMFETYKKLYMEKRSRSLGSSPLE